MTNKQIEKLLTLLNNNQLDELRKELTQQLLNTTDKTQANVFKAVSKYLKNCDSFRPVLQSIQHQNGKQFICSGFSAYIFETYREELEQLKNSTDLESLNIYNIIDNRTKLRELSEEESLILKNIKKFITLYKQQEFYNSKDKHINIYFNNKFFNANMISELVSIMGTDTESMQITCDNGKINQTKVQSKDITAIILPLRITDDDFANKIIDFTNEFIKQVKGA